MVRNYGVCLNAKIFLKKGEFYPLIILWMDYKIRFIC